MIQPQPRKQVCKKCHWSKIIAPDSDVLFRDEDRPEPCCPSCGGELLSKKLNPIDLLTLQKQLLKKHFGR